MSAPAAGLLDTSIFIARESGRALGALPDFERIAAAHPALAVLSV